MQLNPDLTYVIDGFTPSLWKSPKQTIGVANSPTKASANP